MLCNIASAATLLAGACGEAPPTRAPKEAGWIQQECHSFETRVLGSGAGSDFDDTPLVHEGEVVARATAQVFYVLRDGQRRIREICVTIRPRDHELSYRPSFHVREDARARELAIRINAYGPARDDRAFPGYAWTLNIPLQPLGRFDP